MDLIETPPELIDLGEGVRVAVTDGGPRHAPPVVLIHGALASREDMLLTLGERLARRFRVLAVDRPGHGLSERPRMAGSPRDQALAIAEAVQRLGVEKPVVVGHSFGGAVALNWALERPDALTGAVALSPLVYPEFRMEHLLFGPRAVPVAGPWLSQVASLTTDPALMNAINAHMFAPQAIPPAWTERLPHARIRSPEQLTANGEDASFIGPAMTSAVLRYAACPTPISFIVGGADQVVDRRRHGALAVEHFPNARLTLLPGVGHMLHHFAPDAVEAAINDVTMRAAGASVPPDPVERSVELRA